MFSRLVVDRLYAVGQSSLTPRQKAFLKRQLPGLAQRQAGPIRWGSVRRLEPFSRKFGRDRGTPIDRYYIENFLAAHGSAIRGKVLEVKSDAYARRFGGGAVECDVLDINDSNPAATVIADLNDAKELPTGRYDCIILTQTLQLIYDLRAAVRELHRSLKPGGVLLITVPGITSIESRETGDSWYWSFTHNSIRRLVLEHFDPSLVQVEAHGNVLAAIGFLHGVAAEELTPAELAHRDPSYEVILTVVARKVAD